MLLSLSWQTQLLCDQVQLSADAQWRKGSVQSERDSEDTTCIIPSEDLISSYIEIP